MAATSGMGGGMQGRFLGNSGELNPEIWDAANVRFCLGEDLLLWLDSVVKRSVAAP